MMSAENIAILSGTLAFAGTIMGVILGTLLDVIKSNWGKRSVQIINQSIFFSKPDHIISDETSTPFTFNVVFINRKEKAAIVENVTCAYYFNRKLLKRTECFDLDTKKNHPRLDKLDEFEPINVPANSSKTVTCRVYLTEAYTKCDTIMLEYSYGTLKRKKIISKKERTR